MIVWFNLVPDLTPGTGGEVEFHARHSTISSLK